MDTVTATPRPGEQVKLYNADGSSREVKLVDITTDGKYVILSDGGENFTRPISRLSPPVGATDVSPLTLDDEVNAAIRQAEQITDYAKTDAGLALDPAKIADAQAGHDAVAEAFERADKGIDPSYWRLDDAVVAARNKPRTRIETKFYIAQSIDMKLESDFAVEELDELKNDGWHVVHRQFIGANYYAELERIVIVEPQPVPDQPSAAVEQPVEPQPEAPAVIESPEISPVLPTPETAIALPPDNPFKSQPVTVPTPVTEPQPAIEIDARAMAASMLRGQSASSVIAMMDQQLMQRSAARRQAVQ